MALKLTPYMLKQAYDLLSATEPFNRWNLPDSDDVVFRVLKARGTSAQLWTGAGKPCIDVSTEHNGHLNTVLSSLAHEMVHLHEARCKIRSRGTNHHGAAFRKWAAQVCKAHGYDLKLFY